MVKRSALVRLVSLWLLSACAALSQSDPGPLPDAPSAQLPTPVDWSHTMPAEVVRLRIGSVGVSAGTVRETDAARAMLGPRPNEILINDEAPVRKESLAFFGKILYPASEQTVRYRPSTGGSIMSRATDAASSILFTRDQFGERKLDTSYLIRVLTSVAAHTAYRPYWARSTSAPFSDFGSTVGNDAGMNILHEFGPDIRQTMTAHMPKFVYRMQERIIRDSKSR